MLAIQKYERGYQERVITFLAECLPQSGRALDLSGRHKIYSNIEQSFECFWYLLDEERVVGTVGIKKLSKEACELKSLYLLAHYHGQRLGYTLLHKAVSWAKENGYAELYLDTLTSSKKAIALYQSAGFMETQRYNENETADLFMVLNLADAGGLMPTSEDYAPGG